ncbi:hypothetical protein BDW68DRAFT_194855 [Aspergillus falconensis]
MHTFAYYPTVGWAARTKSRTGCTVCKARKVKCDETKPCCRRCHKTARKCSYEVEGRHTSSIWPSQPLSDIATYTIRERRAFRYYYERAAPALAGNLGCRFWTHTVPSACRAEPAVWDAVNAISELYENLNPFLGPPMVMESTASVKASKAALSWYLRSMQNVQSQITRNNASPHLALISCVLYTCAELLQGDLAKTRDSGGETASTFKDIIPLLIRLGAAVFITTACYPRGLPGLLALPVEASFQSLEDAQTTILKLAAECHSLRYAASQHYRYGRTAGAILDLVAKQRSLASQLEEWDSAFAYLTSLEGHRPADCIHQGPVSVLLAIRAATFIMINTCFAQQETQYDAHMVQFQTVVDNAETTIGASAARGGAQLGFTFEAEFGPPLFFTAIKCRNRELRWKALALLRQAPKIQSLFKCISWAILAETIILIEEGTVQGIVELRPLDPMPTHWNSTESPINYDTRGDPHRTQAPTTSDLVEVDRSFAGGLQAIDKHCIPEEQRVHEFGVFQTKGNWHIAIPQQKHAIVLRFTRIQRDPIRGACRRVEDFLPVAFS